MPFADSEWQSLRRVPRAAYAQPAGKGITSNHAGGIDVAARLVARLGEGNKMTSTSTGIGVSCRAAGVADRVVSSTVAI